jgi:hypothetical protein
MATGNKKERVNQSENDEQKPPRHIIKLVTVHIRVQLRNCCPKAQIHDRQHGIHSQSSKIAYLILLLGLDKLLHRQICEIEFLDSLPSDNSFLALILHLCSASTTVGRC